MKTIILLPAVLFFFTFTSPNLHSQNTPGLPDSSKNSLVKGSWSAQFELGTYLISGRFETFLISFKRHFTQNSSLRAGLGYNTYDNTGNETFSSDTNSILKPTESTSTTVIASLTYLFYPNPNSSVNIFFGAGPIYKYNRYKYNDNFVDFGPYGMYEHYSTNSIKNWSAGLNGIFGAEWFPIKWLSLMAEYAANVMWGKSERSGDNFSHSSGYDPDISHGSSESNTFETNFNVVRLGISAYF